MTTWTKGWWFFEVRKFSEENEQIQAKEPLGQNSDGFLKHENFPRRMSRFNQVCPKRFSWELKFLLVNDFFKASLAFRKFWQSKRLPPSWNWKKYGYPLIKHDFQTSISPRKTGTWKIHGFSWLSLKITRVNEMLFMTKSCHLGADSSGGYRGAALYIYIYGIYLYMYV